MTEALTNQAITARRIELESVLLAAAPFWREMPFRIERPQWVDAFPELDAELQCMPMGALAQLLGDNSALVQWLSDRVAIPGYRSGLIHVAALARVGGNVEARSAWGVPGRKLAQIEAFASAVGKPPAAVLEWCAGKGHLGRLVAMTRGVDVTSLEIDPALCHAGERLAERARAAGQTFVVGDALRPEAAAMVAGRYVMALHACGDLHRDLVSAAAGGGAAGVAISPCCYYRLREIEYCPFSSDSRLRVSRDELHLAVTETVTAPDRNVRERDRAAQWKLAFVAWREASGGGYQTFKPVPSAWMLQPFSEFMARICDREGLASPPSSALSGLLKEGQRRFDVMMRRSAVRLAFRRVMELWLVCDLATPLIDAGFRVSIDAFCDRMLTPRNLLLNATAPG
ncbi:methyltransferase [Niveibacterium microcysteis]|uniref:Methyltransferase n=1 Tax=Niveibacterium microcysteis TaxID=2811415 RepID=A0ABX7M400_9RHOO|nr:methyltransferase [Niveibacterium microcysteis]QSI75493.1 methyltransferase [Niveibacterium microcysteis]